MYEKRNDSENRIFWTFWKAISKGKNHVCQWPQTISTSCRASFCVDRRLDTTML
jgi:hypothetical protein